MVGICCLSSTILMSETAIIPILKIKTRKKIKRKRKEKKKITYKIISRKKKCVYTTLSCGFCVCPHSSNLPPHAFWTDWIWQHLNEIQVQVPSWWNIRDYLIKWNTATIRIRNECNFLKLFFSLPYKAKNPKFSIHIVTFSFPSV